MMTRTGITQFVEEQMKRVSYYFSVLSPYAYLAEKRLEEIVRTRDAFIEYKPLDIMGMFSQTGGLPPKDRHPSRQRYRLMDIERLSRLNQLPLNLVPKFWPTDPQPASLAIIKASRQQGNIADLVHNILASCWARDLNIADQGVINNCLVESGFNTSDPSDINLDEALRIYENNTNGAIESGVFGSPTYRVDGQLFWGQDRLDHLKEMLDGELDN